ncbi:hypothetical protein HKX48_000237 [Thoreauomyces humboldtii]|nr:hypothetical protein HKX48_000237 [Thoreauomyces humboldtii]
MGKRKNKHGAKLAWSKLDLFPTPTTTTSTEQPSLRSSHTAPNAEAIHPHPRLHSAPMSARIPSDADAEPNAGPSRAFDSEATTMARAAREDASGSKGTAKGSEVGTAVDREPKKALRIPSKRRNGKKPADVTDVIGHDAHAIVQTADQSSGWDDERSTDHAEWSAVAVKVSKEQQAVPDAEVEPPTKEPSQKRLGDVDIAANVKKNHPSTGKCFTQPVNERPGHETPITRGRSGIPYKPSVQNHARPERPTPITAFPRARSGPSKGYAAEPNRSMAKPWSNNERKSSGNKAASEHPFAKQGPPIAVPVKAWDNKKNKAEHRRGLYSAAAPPAPRTGPPAAVKAQHPSNSTESKHPKSQVSVNAWNKGLQYSGGPSEAPSAVRKTASAPDINRTQEPPEKMPPVPPVKHTHKKKSSLSLPRPAMASPSNPNPAPKADLKSSTSSQHKREDDESIPRGWTPPSDLTFTAPPSKPQAAAAAQNRFLQNLRAPKDDPSGTVNVVTMLKAAGRTTVPDHWTAPAPGEQSCWRKRRPVRTDPHDYPEDDDDEAMETSKVDRWDEEVDGQAVFLQDIPYSATCKDVREFVDDVPGRSVLGIYMGYTPKGEKTTLGLIRLPTSSDADNLVAHVNGVASTTTIARPTVVRMRATRVLDRWPDGFRGQRIVFHEEVDL